LPAGQWPWDPTVPVFEPVPVAMMVPRTEAEGPGVRFAVWVQGCPFRCPGCCNPEMLAFDGRSTPWTAASLAAAVAAEEVEGLSLLGGEPFAHAAALAPLAEAVRGAGRTVMVFSGYTLAELREATDPAVPRLLAATDLLVDGRFEAARGTVTRRWVGSDNQVMHFLSDRYAPEDPRFAEPNHVEIRLRGGEIVVNGWPVFGARRLVRATGPR